MANQIVETAENLDEMPVDEVLTRISALETQAELELKRLYARLDDERRFLAQEKRNALIMFGCHTPGHSERFSRVHNLGAVVA